MEPRNLAATAENKIAPLWFGPGSPLGEDSLAPELLWPEQALCFLNPEFGNIPPWAKKCAESGSRILFLTPGSIDSEWYAKFVEPYAYVLGLSPRLKFKGANDPFPKPCILSCYGFYGFTGFDTWRWKK